MAAPLPLEWSPAKLADMLAQCKPYGSLSADASGLPEGRLATNTLTLPSSMPALDRAQRCQRKGSGSQQPVATAKDRLVCLPFIDHLRCLIVTRVRELRGVDQNTIPELPPLVTEGSRLYETNLRFVLRYLKRVRKVCRRQQAVTGVPLLVTIRWAIQLLHDISDGEAAVLLASETDGSATNVSSPADGTAPSPSSSKTANTELFSIKTASHPSTPDAPLSVKDEKDDDDFDESLLPGGCDAEGRNLDLTTEPAEPTPEAVNQHVIHEAHNRAVDALLPESSVDSALTPTGAIILTETIEAVHAESDPAPLAKVNMTELHGNVPEPADHNENESATVDTLCATHDEKEYESLMHVFLFAREDGPATTHGAQESSAQLNVDLASNDSRADVAESAQHALTQDGLCMTLVETVQPLSPTTELDDNQKEHDDLLHIFLFPSEDGPVAEQGNKSAFTTDVPCNSMAVSANEPVCDPAIVPEADASPDLTAQVDAEITLDLADNFSVSVLDSERLGIADAGDHHDEAASTLDQSMVEVATPIIAVEPETPNHANCEHPGLPAQSILSEGALSQEEGSEKDDHLGQVVHADSPDQQIAPACDDKLDFAPISPALSTVHDPDVAKPDTHVEDCKEIESGPSAILEELTAAGAPWSCPPSVHPNDLQGHGVAIATPEMAASYSVDAAANTNVPPKWSLSAILAGVTVSAAVVATTAPVFSAVMLYAGITYAKYNLRH